SKWAAMHHCIAPPRRRCNAGSDWGQLRAKKLKIPSNTISRWKIRIRALKQRAVSLKQNRSVLSKESCLLRRPKKAQHNDREAGDEAAGDARYFLRRGLERRRDVDRGDRRSIFQGASRSRVLRAPAIPDGSSGADEQRGARP